MHVIWLVVNDLCIICHSFLAVITREKTDFSEVTYTRLLQSFSLLKPFLTIDCKLAFRSASIQSTTAGENNVLHCIVSFHSELHHNTEEKTSFKERFSVISYDLGVWNISWLLSWELFSYPSVSVQICVNPSLSAATWVWCLGISAVSIVRSSVDTSKPDEGSLGLYKAWTLKTFKERFTPFLHQITDFIQMKSFRQLIHNCTATVNLCCLLKKHQLMGLEQSEDE